MYKTLIGEREIEIDVFEIADKIDNVFHVELTSKAGITVDHHEIAKFVISILDKNNAEEKEFTKLVKDIEEALKKKEG